MLIPYRDNSGLLVFDDDTRLGEAAILNISGLVSQYPRATITFSGVTNACCPVRNGITSEPTPTNGAHCVPHWSATGNIYAWDLVETGGLRAGVFLGPGCGGGVSTDALKDVTTRLLWWNGTWTLERWFHNFAADDRLLFRGQTTTGALPLLFTNQIVADCEGPPAGADANILGCYAYGGAATVEFLGCGSYAVPPVDGTGTSIDTSAIRTCCEVIDVTISGATPFAGLWRLTKRGAFWTRTRYDHRTVSLFKSAGQWFLGLSQPTLGFIPAGGLFTRITTDAQGREAATVTFNGGFGACPSGPWTLGTVAGSPTAGSFDSITTSRCWAVDGLPAAGTTESPLAAFP